jgi:hypothetical protein
MINTQLRDRIAATWSKTQQRDFYKLVDQKRKKIRDLIHRVREQQ